MTHNLAVVCNETNVPGFNNFTTPGTTNLEEMKEKYPDRWNTYERRYASL